MSEKSRAKGCFFGLFCGDALGATLEFSLRDSKPEVTEMVGGGVFKLKPGEWTDDGAMAVAFAKSLTDWGRLNGKDLMKKWVRWYTLGAYSSNHRCFDIGTSTRASLNAFMAGKPRTSQFADGNGPIMRLAPLAIFHTYSSLPALMNDAAAQSRLTHGGEVAEQCSVELAVLLWKLIKGEGMVALSQVYDLDALQMTREEVSSSGYADDTLHAAIWCVWNTDSAEQAITTAANLGEDSDTVAAVAGAIAGALYGYDALPRRWVKKLARLEYLERTFDELWRSA